MTHNKALVNSVQQNAREILPRLTRSKYADDVIAGNQEWSGADLKGKARRYGGSYASMRIHARTALHRAGGCLQYCGKHGRTLLCVRVGQDDYGNAIFQTELGPAVATESSRLSML
jgi:hypothetical protein